MRAFDPWPIAEGEIAGDSVRIPRGNLLQAGGGTDPAKIVLTGPRGKRDVPVAESGDFVLPPLEAGSAR